MIKTLVAAAFATVSLAAIAAPAQAASFTTDSSYSISTNEDSIIQRLTEKGVDVQSVEDWSGYVRAFVTKADGSNGMVIYDPIYLNQVDGTAAL